MNLTGVLKESALAIKRHTVLVAPSVLSVLTVALIIELSFRSNSSIAPGAGDGVLPEMNENMGRVVLTGVVNVFFQILSQTVTTAMAEDAASTGGCSLRGGFYAAYPKLLDILLIAAALIVPPAVFISMARAFPSMDAFYHLSALVAGVGCAFYFMFAVVALTVENFNAPSAMLKSFTVVRQNTRAAMRLFLSVGAMGFVVAAASIALSYIPVLGYPAYIAVSGLYMTFTSVVFLKSYRALPPPRRPTDYHMTHNPGRSAP